MERKQWACKPRPQTMCKGPPTRLWLQDREAMGGQVTYSKYLNNCIEAEERHVLYIISKSIKVNGKTGVLYW